MTSLHQVSEHVAINGTKPQPESGPSWDHVGTKSGPSRDQVIFQPPPQSTTQLHKIYFSLNGIKSVTKQVGEQVTKHVTEQVSATNYRGHRDLAAEVNTAKVTARVTAKVTTYPGASKT